MTYSLSIVDRNNLTIVETENKTINDLEIFIGLQSNGVFTQSGNSYPAISPGFFLHLSQPEDIKINMDINKIKDLKQVKIIWHKL